MGASSSTNTQPIIMCMWLFRHKFKANGSLDGYKAKLFVNGKSQTMGIDCHKTFSLVLKPTTIQIVLSLAIQWGWLIHQLDVKNVFLHGNLHETVFMHQPPGFLNARFPSHVYRLRKFLCGLKQAPHAWYTWFAAFITSDGFQGSTYDSS